ncbi:uncharacterized protein [Henckelia pumila]|uniref:uncharacterized protein n=1 Tax=Henckelia pumila TaxID=405737 RepID=UPI003C6DD4A9
MNSQVFSPLFPSSSSSSSNGDLDDLKDSYIKEEHLIAPQIHNNNIILCESVRHQNANITHGGSVPGRRTIYRDRENAAQNLFNDYFVENPTYNEEMFRRRFRMSRILFLHIVDAVQNHDSYFVQRRNAAGKLGLTTLQKVTAAFRILTYALPADATDEYIKIGESTAIECVKRFCRAIVEIFKGQYLRSPTANDIARLLHIGEQRGFPRIGIAPPAHFVLQGIEYNMEYYLSDNIYPKCSTLVQTIHDPCAPKKKYFATKQEVCRKDVERAFGVLQSRFAIVANPSRFWSKSDLHDIMTACIIMHNMVVEYERNLDAPIEDVTEVPIPNIENAENENSRFQQFIGRYKIIRNVDAHIALRNALIDHLWKTFSNAEN